MDVKYKMEQIIKRKRSPNWSATEKALLKDCLKDFISTIENKCTDTNTNKAKALAWQKVLQRFSELNDIGRSLSELKQQWRIIKMDAKKCHSDYKRRVNLTGGGERPPSPDPQTNEIIEMIPQEFEEDNNIFDSDTINSEIQNSTQAGGNNSTKEQQPPEIEHKKIFTKQDLDEEVLEIRELSSPRRAVKRAHEKSTLSETKLRNTIVIECLKSENSLKLKQMKEAHEWAKQEHMLKMEKLNLEIQILKKNYSKES